MQLLSPLTRDERAMAKEKPAGFHLPYARHVDDHTIETRDGLLMQFIQLRGLLFETADTDEINYRKRLREPRFFDLWLTRASKTPRVKNYQIWRCNSYRP